MFDDIWGDRLQNVFVPISNHFFSNDYAIPDMKLEEIRMLRSEQRYEAYRSD